MPLVVGLAGKYCAGKSTIADFLAGEGAWRIDVDSLGHAAREQCRDALAARFGEAALDRKALGRLVFADPAALASLEAIVHPVMDAMVLEKIAARTRELAMAGSGQRCGPAADPESASATGGSAPESGRPPVPAGRFSHIILVDAALLFRNGFDRHCALSLWIDAPFLLRLWRGLRRDRRGLRATLDLMRRQAGLGPQPSEENADIFRVRNLGRQTACSRVRSILERYNGKK